MTLTIPENAVFISVGSSLTSSQEHFVIAIETLLSKYGLRFITLGRNAPSDSDPLAAIRAIVSATAGTLVIAFPRLSVISGVERPSSETPAFVEGRNLPTVWNQIEAAMAYEAGKPLLIFIEEGTYPEGIIDPSVYPCHAFSLPSKPGSLPASVRRVLGHWIASMPANR